MPTSPVDRLFLAFCFWLMRLGLRLFELGNYLSEET